MGKILDMAIEVIRENPGIWTASICRELNGIPQNKQGVLFCGTCEGYANIRKRQRAERMKLNHLLPEFDDRPNWELHEQCDGCKFTSLRSVLNKYIKEEQDILMSKPAFVPDDCQPRGYDYATSYWYYPDIEDTKTFWDYIVDSQIVDLRKYYQEGGLSNGQFVEIHQNKLDL